MTKTKMPTIKILVGKSFQEGFDITMEHYNTIVKKMKKKFGDAIWNEDKDKFLTETEKEWLRMGLAFKMLKGKKHDPK